MEHIMDSCQRLRVYCVSRGEGARGLGPREWGPRGSLTVHGGPGAPGLAPAGAVGPTRQPHPRARAADGRAPRGGHSARPKAATRRGRREAAPTPLWSPAAAIGTAERRPREGKGRRKRGGGPRLTLGRRRRRKRRPERRKAAARLGSTGSTAFRRSADLARGWTGSMAVRRSWRRRRRGGRRSRRAEKAGRRSSATEERESDGASSILAGRRRGKGGNG
uniref:Splicing coactivator subunit-like protein n=1 Tax=Oryza sativa subsp. japonica TaxID=39947 RepID=Q6YSV9_ORYSJ|nr:splicing coactivator subunit-like protein [Oryza sativa Japonica Group]